MKQGTDNIIMTGHVFCDRNERETALFLSGKNDYEMDSFPRSVEMGNGHGFSNQMVGYATK